MVTSPCTVHFGLHKTGSSAIQSFFSCSPQSHILYPDLGESNQSRPLATAFRHDAADYHLNRKSGLNPEAIARRSKEVRASLDAAFTTLGPRRMVLSAEDLSLFAEQDLASFFHFLGERSTSTEGIAYVRGVGSWLESLFQESLKNSRCLPQFGQAHPLYRPRLEKFDRLLGRSHVRLVRYAPDNFAGQCVVRDFALRIGAEPPSRPLQRRNASLSLPAVRLLAVYRKWRPSPLPQDNRLAEENKRLHRILQDLRGEPLRFHPSVADHFVGRNRADIEWAEDRLGFPVIETVASENPVRCAADLLILQKTELDWLAEKCGLATASLPASQPDLVAKALNSLAQSSGTSRRWLQAGRGLLGKLAAKHRP